MRGRNWALVWACGAVAMGTMSAAAQDRAVTEALVEKTAQANFPEFFEMLSLANDAVVPADIQKNADWLEVAFKKRG